MATSKVKTAEPLYGVPDEDTPELTAEMLARAIPFPELLKQLGLPAIGRPKLANPKQAVNLRLDPEIVTHFKAGGRGWQTRINAALKAHVAAEQKPVAEAPSRSRKRA
jgi:uncharacterized protein (DUF4415 family)